ncbi:hypothetical protein EVAR_102765_1 [Eumeta japonica]|uniref:Uncharacterized protein n=1 Tax=Eumeta variegata TaxID=151549 RepID=A0A4C1TL28_EUMVA|nr:hypothetical protein EVAR_102765_1 [Eumeta japonica]
MKQFPLSFIRSTEDGGARPARAPGEPARPPPPPIKAGQFICNRDSAAARGGGGGREREESSPGRKTSISITGRWTKSKKNKMFLFITRVDVAAGPLPLTARRVYAHRRLSALFKAVIMRSTNDTKTKSIHFESAQSIELRYCSISRDPRITCDSWTVRVHLRALSNDLWRKPKIIMYRNNVARLTHVT